MSVALTNPTYSGEFSGKYLAAALLSASTLDSGAITILPNVKFKAVIQKGATDDIVKDADCNFVAGGVGTLTLTEAIIQPDEFQVNLELCKKTMHASWQAEQMGYSAHDSLAPSFADFVIAHVAAKVADRTEKNIWSGATATSGQFDGFTAKLTADADVIDVVGTSVTAANVIDELGKVVDAVPTEVYGSEDLTLYVSSNVARSYVRALGGFGTNLGANGTDGKGTQWFNGGALSFDGVNIFVAKGLGDNKIIAAQKSNLYFGTGLENDQNEVKVLDMSDIDGSQNIRVVMRFTAGVQHVYGSEVVLYS